ncbi:HAD-IA family hydrolase [Aeromonas diversa]|uniref:HAD-IA family hydrolase n=1 Tax=Aeromonas diversa TaxID=502790 RepID=UPI00399F5BE2
MKITHYARGLLLDMDGTLVDSTALVERVWGLWCERHDLPLEPVLAACHGVRAEDLIERLFPWLDAARESAWLDELELANSHVCRPLPGAREVLERLAPHQWALVTSAGREPATLRLQAAGLPLPTHLICAEQVVRGKPDPQAYLLGAERLGWSPKECLAFEDAAAGILSARRAGCPVVQVGGTRELGEVLARIGDWRQVSLTEEGEKLRLDLDGLG